MGFDPRHWSTRERSEQRVTSNVEALLAENDALRREVARLNRELERVQRWRFNRDRTPREDATGQESVRVRPDQVQAWGTALAAQQGWSVLRQNALMTLVDQLNRAGFPAHLSLQQRLDRLAPGLGRDLMAAIGPKASKKTAAVLAAFALYGVRASEWLDEDPRRVVADLRQRVSAGTASAEDRRQRRGRRTRSDRRQSDRADASQPRDPRAAALAVLGLEPGASLEAIKQAFRQLVKQHHPDMGGSADEFRRVSEAYQQLIS